MHRRLSLSLLWACLCLAGAAFAAEAIEPEIEAGDTPVIATSCNLNGFKSEYQKFEPAVTIPDGDATGVRVGPIQFADDGSAIADIVVELKIAHPRIGDLVVSVGYDETCDGTIDESSVLMCRVGRATCTGGTGTGCSSDLSCGKSYMFDDSAADRIGLTAAGACRAVSVIGDGCFKPTGAGATPLSIFKDKHKGGCWYLTVVDPVTPQKGSICEWAVHLLNHQPVAVQGKTWAGTKVLYQ